MTVISTGTTTTNTLRTVITRTNQIQLVTQLLRTSKLIPSGGGGKNYSLSSALGRESRKCLLLRLHMSVPLVFTQVDVSIFLPPYGRNSVRPPQISGFRASITMVPGKCDAGRFTSALFTEDYLPTHEKGKSNPQLHTKPLLHNEPPSTYSSNGKVEPDQRFVTSRSKTSRQNLRRRTL